MFNFEKKQIPQTENKKKSDLPFILKAVGLSALTIGGLEAGKLITQNNAKQKQKQKIEVESQIKKYSLDNIEKQEDFLTPEFIEEVALTIPNCKKNEENQDVLKRKYSLIHLVEDAYNSNYKFDHLDSMAYEKSMHTYETGINKAKKELTTEDKHKAKEHISQIIDEIEKVKGNLITHISSEEYLDKLAKEFNLSNENAKKHQDKRIKNIKNLIFDLKCSAEIGNVYDQLEGKPVAFAYYIPETNKLVLPYDIDLNKPAVRKYFQETIMHEILHESTDFEKGMSKESISTLKNSFQENPKENESFNKYFSSPGELIVRKQILDLEMEKLGIKKYDEEFTFEHYFKLLVIKKFLSQEALELLNHIKPKDFPKVMNKLAKLEDGGKTKFSPVFDYGKEATA